MLGVKTEGEIIQHVALFLDFNCNCSAYSPSVQVTHASGCTSAKVKILCGGPGACQEDSNLHALERDTESLKWH